MDTAASKLASSNGSRRPSAPCTVSQPGSSEERRSSISVETSRAVTRQPCCESRRERRPVPAPASSTRPGRAVPKRRDDRIRLTRPDVPQPGLSERAALVYRRELVEVLGPSTKIDWRGGGGSHCLLLVSNAIRYSSCTSRAASGHAHDSSMVLRAASDWGCQRSELERIPTIASASANGSPGATSAPLTPCSTSGARHSTVVATTGSPAAIASAAASAGVIVTDQRNGNAATWHSGKLCLEVLERAQPNFGPRLPFERRSPSGRPGTRKQQKSQARAGDLDTYPLECGNEIVDSTTGLRASREDDDRIIGPMSLRRRHSRGAMNPSDGAGIDERGLDACICGCDGGDTAGAQRAASQTQRAKFGRGKSRHRNIGSVLTKIRGTQREPARRASNSIARRNDGPTGERRRVGKRRRELAAVQMHDVRLERLHKAVERRCQGRNGRPPRDQVMRYKSFGRVSGCAVTNEMRFDGGHRRRELDATTRDTVGRVPADERDVEDAHQRFAFRPTPAANAMTHPTKAVAHAIAPASRDQRSLPSSVINAAIVKAAIATTSNIHHPVSASFRNSAKALRTMTHFRAFEQGRRHFCKRHCSRGPSELAPRTDPAQRAASRSASAPIVGATVTPPLARTESLRPGTAYAIAPVPCAAASETTSPQPSRTDVTTSACARPMRSSRS